MKHTRTHGLLACATLGLLLLALPSQAQPVYRIVGPDGKVTFSDKPPVTGTATTAKPSAAAGNGGGALPFELRQVAGKFPVTLFTNPKCAPCDTARSFLTTRGVPFAEKTVISNEDIGSFQRLFGDSTLPAATLGAQQLKGFSESEWASFLDAANYPKTSVLPASYRNPPPAPLVVLQTAPEPSAGTAPPPSAGNAATRPPAPPPPPAGDNPAGIKF